MKIEQLKIATPQVLEDINNLIPQLSQNAKPMTEARLKEMIADQCSTILVGKDNERIICIGMVVVYNVPTEKRAWIEEVIVDQNYRGQGLGEKISKQLIEIAKQKGAARMYLTSGPTRLTARALYEKLGFKKKDTQPYRLEL